MVDVGLFIAYILIGVCLLAAVGMPLMKVVGDFESLKKMGIGFGTLFVVFFVSYFISSGETSGDVTANTAKMVGAGLTTFYLLTIMAILGIVYTEIKKAKE